MPLAVGRQLVWKTALSVNLSIESNRTLAPARLQGAEACHPLGTVECVGIEQEAYGSLETFLGCIRRLRSC